MGRLAKRNNSVAESSGDNADMIIGPQGVNHDSKGKFQAEIESEIAGLRERMNSSRKVGSFSVETVGGSDGVVRPFSENMHTKGETHRAIVRERDETSRGLDAALTKEAPESPIMRSSGGEHGVGGGSVVRSSTFDLNNFSNTTPGSPVARASDSAVVSSTPDENRRKLRALAQKVKLALTQKGERPSGNELDEALAELTRVSGHCRALCAALVQFEVKRRTELHEKMRRGGDEPISHEELVKALEKAPRLMEVREWRNLVASVTAKLSEKMAQTARRPWGASPDGSQITAEGNGTYLQQHFRVKEDLSYLTQLLEFPSLGDSHEPTSHGPGGVQRGDTVAQEDTASQRSDSSVQESETHKGGPGARPTTTQEIDISGRGDSILEFSVSFGDMADDMWPRGTPTPCKASFRVSSHILAETSAVFAQLFSGRSMEGGPAYAFPRARGAFPRPRPGVARDGTRVNIYCMSPLLPGEIRPLEILLYAAHMHSDKVPREIGFEHFVAIAKLCLRFQCTAPLELVVDMCWLPEWVHMGTEAIPEGLLLISYAFGSRGIFTRMTKSVILNIVDEAELEARRWPPELKEKIWAVRQAKMEQIHACCVTTVQEYLRPPRESARGSNVSHGRPKSIFDLDDEEPGARLSSPPPAPPASQSLFPYLLSASTPPAADTSFPTSTPRCPKGRHECDAANLGYLMIVLAELQLLPVVMNAAALARMPGSAMGSAAGQFPPRSLAQLVRILQRIPSPPNAIHKGGVCDPMPAFRNAVIDIFNSLSGITLYDVTGKHGYALSRQFEKTPQRRLGPAGILDVAAGQAMGVEVPEGVALGILRALDTATDMRAVAMISRRFYETYKRHEMSLTSRFSEKPQDEQSPYGTPSFDVLTEEEARKIIWPDSPEPPPQENEEGGASSEPLPLDIGDEEPQGAREKFRAEDALFTEGKVLSVIETKQLTVEHDAHLGMHRDKVEVEGCV